MPNMPGFEAGNLSLHPTETGVDATANAAQRVGQAFNRQASGQEILAQETDRLASATKTLGGETQRVGGETAALGSLKGSLIEDTGRRIGSSIVDAGDAAVKYMDHQQISRGAPAFASLLQQATNDWNNRIKNADPNDPTIAASFMNSLNDKLSQFEEKGFYTEEGQKWAEAHVDALRQHFADTTRADMSTLAGQAAVVNQQQTINGLSNTVRADPSSLDFSLAALKSSTEGMLASSPNLTGVQTGKARTEIMQKGAELIVKSATFGYIEKTGQMPPWASDPKYAPYINGAELKQFEQTARVYQHQAQAEARAQRADRDYNVKNDFNQKATQLEIDTAPQKPGDPPRLPDDYWQRLRDLTIHPGAALDPGRIKTLMDAGEHITDRLNKPEPLGQISHDTTIDLLGRIRATDESKLTSNDEIYKAYGAGKLNRADFKFLTDQYNELKTPDGEALNKRQGEFIESVKPLIDKSNPMMGKIDQSGHQQVYNFTIDLQKKVAEYRRTGKDPRDLMDPSKPDYMGAPAALVPYQKPLQQSLQDAAAAMRNGNLTGPGKDITGVQVTPAPAATSVPRPAAAKPPTKGFVKDGYEFLGGNPGEAASWRKVEERS